VASVSPVQSRQHPIVRRCRALARRRDADGAVLLDGEHLLEEALVANVAVDLVLTSLPKSTAVERAGRQGIAVHHVTPAVLEAASPVRSPGGVVSIASWQPASVDATLTGPLPLVVGLVDVQDPGNVGSAIRSADALGATGVLALDASADPAGWKALRGAMGSTFHLPVGRGSSAAALDAARRLGLRVAATLAETGIPTDRTDLAGPILLLFGSEGAGLPDAIRAAADVRLTIPMRPGANSLNIAVTTALVLDEARRQRRAPR
jgi:RNA methyltransferase, TrmH family